MQGWVAVSESEAHCRELQRRVAIRGGGVPVPTNLRMLDRLEVADKHQWLTVVHAPLTVEAGERCSGLATCARTARRRSERGTDASTLRRRASWPK